MKARALIVYRDTVILIPSGPRRKRNPPRRPGWMKDPARWVRLASGEAGTVDYHPELRRLVDRSGVYALRDRETREVLYVGESHTGRLYRTLLRHFQDRSGRFKKLGEWVSAAPLRLDVAWWVTAPGQALGREKDVIEWLCPSGNVETCEKLKGIPI